MTIERLNDIKERVARTSDEPLVVGVKIPKDAPDSIGTVCVTYADHPLGRLPEGVPCITVATCGPENDEKSVNDAHLFAHARKDLVTLIAEVERLQAFAELACKLYPALSGEWEAMREGV